MNIRKLIEKEAKRKLRSNKIRVAHENCAWYVYTYLGNGKYLVSVDEKGEICFELI